MINTETIIIANGDTILNTHLIMGLTYIKTLSGWVDHLPILSIVLLRLFIIFWFEKSQSFIGCPAHGLYVFSFEPIASGKT